jgi:hypothetical protein
VGDVADQLPTAEQVQQALAHVYTRAEFQPAKHTWRDWLWAQAGKALSWLGRLFSGLRGLRETSPWLFGLIIGTLVLVLAALVAHIVWTAWKLARMGGDDGTASATNSPRRQRPRTAADWDAEAARLAGEGRLREAAVALYQGLVLRLDALGAVRFDASKTPGDYRREARKHPEASLALGGFLRQFEPVAFGGRDLDGDGWERLRAAAAEGAPRG